ncbi:rhodanese-like domain-containing protein [Nocardioides sp. zg-DK7169]|nr:rhodanese-like domain-containing protein [Nocardioides sp. zg-DK7169]NPC98111.1 rhodanese-like domain-containing protein [Nocardioides sp. zg-DK7169]
MEARVPPAVPIRKLAPVIPTVSIDGVPNPLPEGLAVLDVREDVEWQHGHIEGAVHIPLMDLPARLEEVPDEQVLVVCRVGGRSSQAVGWLVQQGRDVVNLDGGMYAWADAGRPMVSENGQAPQVV